MTAMGAGAASALDPAAIAWGPDGLVPAVVQDERDGRVLMLAWMDREALDATLSTGEVHFHSRSRGRLWKKGETSGNVLRLRAISADCDGDSLLIAADPVGPTCHRGTRSCFDDAVGAPRGEGFGWLEELWATIGALGPRNGRPAPTPSSCSTAASTSSVARSPRKPRKSSSRPRTTRTRAPRMQPRSAPI